ncbi:hypothetical protein LIT25_12290 [Bacillus sp. F19]|nr:hypothetical protein LIT25_12290 [Bacillus sp. F19]
MNSEFEDEIAGEFAKGEVQVRVKADENKNRLAGKVLVSDQAYSYD